MWILELLDSVSAEAVEQTANLFPPVIKNDEVVGEIPEDIRPLLAAEAKLQADTMKGVGVGDVWLLEQLHVLRQVTAVSLKQAGFGLQGDEYFASGWKIARPKSVPSRRPGRVVRLV